MTVSEIDILIILICMEVTQYFKLQDLNIIYVFNKAVICEKINYLIKLI